MGSRTYLVEIAGEDLDAFQARVAEEEAASGEFVANEVSSEGNQLRNRVTFRSLAGGAVPAAPVFTPLGQVPAGRTPTWTGVVALGAANLAISMYRE